MIYTVTFNPSLDYIVSVNHFRTGLTNRTDSELILPGGKGINVSVVLGNLGIESTALGFTAGFTGREIRRAVEAYGVKADFIELPSGLSRINVKLKSIEGTEINGRGPDITGDDIECLMEKLRRLREGDVLVLAGSIPSSVPDTIYQKMMRELSGRNILIVVDAEKELLANVLADRPFLIKPNHHELGELLKTRLTTREEVIPCALELKRRGARNVLVSMAGEGAVLAADDGRIYQAPAPEGKLVNAVGAGDSMVAGFLAGWLEKRDYEHAFYMGLAAGSASAYSDYLAGKKEIKAFYSDCRHPGLGV